MRVCVDSYPIAIKTRLHLLCTWISISFPPVFVVFCSQSCLEDWTVSYCRPAHWVHVAHSDSREDQVTLLLQVNVDNNFIAEIVSCNNPEAGAQTGDDTDEEACPKHAFRVACKQSRQNAGSLVSCPAKRSFCEHLTDLPLARPTRAMPWQVVWYVNPRQMAVHASDVTAAGPMTSTSDDDTRN